MDFRLLQPEHKDQRDRAPRVLPEEARGVLLSPPREIQRQGVPSGLLGQGRPRVHAQAQEMVLAREMVC